VSLLREGSTPYDVLGHDRILALAERFYAHMDEDEPALARLHPLDADGRVHPDNRARFALFLVGWLGGPDDYEQRHGHPRLRMRHGRVPVDEGMRDAWLRCMEAAMDDVGIDGEPRRWLGQRFAETAEFLRNRPARG
jgi:hemoglobin